jgi:hypothetical protein
MPRAATVRMFAPELWGEVDFFSKLCSETYKFSDRDRRALAGVIQHFEKSTMFHSLALKLRPNLDADQAELDRLGYTPATNARELVAVIEAAITELYSSIDCTAKVLRAIYEPGSRGFKKSTRSLFRSFDKIEGTFPDVLKNAFREANWYADLLHLRDELTHLGTGYCSLQQKTGNVQYMHVGIQTQGKPLIVDDIFDWLPKQINSVNLYLGTIFRTLRGSLKNTPVVVFCGMVEGRILMRHLDPTKEVTFASGQCGSYQWFEKPDAPTCPFVAACGAYARTRPMMDPAALLAKDVAKPETD